MNNSKYSFRELLFLILMFVPLTLYAKHDIDFSDIEEPWINGDFDLHDQESLRRVMSEDEKVTYRQQLAFAKDRAVLKDGQFVDNRISRSYQSFYGLAGLYRAPLGIELYAGLDVVAGGGEGELMGEGLNIDTLYVLKKIGAGRSYLGFGRQAVEDARTWMFDEPIDGLSYIYQSEKVAFTGFVGSHNQALEKIFWKWSGFGCWCAQLAAPIYFYDLWPVQKSGWHGCESWKV